MDLVRTPLDNVIHPSKLVAKTIKTILNPFSFNFHRYTRNPQKMKKIKIKITTNHVIERNY